MKINPDDFTEAAWQGIINAKDLALTQNHQNLETEHLLYSLLNKNEIAIKVIERSGGSIKSLIIEVDKFIKNQPKCKRHKNQYSLVKIYHCQFQEQKILNTLSKMILFQVNI